jgi:hypothetical protein
MFLVGVKLPSINVHQGVSRDTQEKFVSRAAAVLAAAHAVGLEWEVEGRGVSCGGPPAGADLENPEPRSRLDLTHVIGGRARHPS